MIRNNLSILMSERNMKNSYLSAKTGISKNTISATSSNDGKMIQLETINKICQVLEVSPCEFFSYLPFDLEIKIYPEKLTITDEIVGKDEILMPVKQPVITELTFDIFMSKVSKNGTIDYLLTGSLTNSVNLFKNISPSFSIVFSSDNADEGWKFWESIPLPFQKDIEKDITLKVIDEVGNQLASYPESHDFDMSQTISYYLDSSFTDLTISMNPY